MFYSSGRSTALANRNPCQYAPPSSSSCARLVIAAWSGESMATDLATAASTVAYASQAFWAPETGGLPLLDPLRSSSVKLSSGPLNYAICYENWFHRTGSYGFRHGAQPASRRP